MSHNLSIDRFAFQVKMARGTVINLGSNTNPAGLEALHVDIRPMPGVHPFLQADALYVPRPDDSFDTVVVGDLLEHMNNKAEAIALLREASRLAPRVVLTVPRDDGILAPDVWAKNLQTPGTHRLWINAATLWCWLEEAGLDVLLWYTIDYSCWPEGYCVVAQRRNAEYALVHAKALAIGHLKKENT